MMMEKTDRIWGHYTVLHENGPSVKLKELVVDPGKSLSMQKHDQRSELWFVSEGSATLYTMKFKGKFELDGVYEKFSVIRIPVGKWHQLRNETDLPLKIIEIQYGDTCVEEDILRF